MNSKILDDIKKVEYNGNGEPKDIAIRIIKDLFMEEVRETVGFQIINPSALTFENLRVVINAEFSVRESEDRALIANLRDQITEIDKKVREFRSATENVSEKVRVDAVTDAIMSDLSAKHKAKEAYTEHNAKISDIYSCIEKFSFMESTERYKLLAMSALESAFAPQEKIDTLTSEISGLDECIKRHNRGADTYVARHLMMYCDQISEIEREIEKIKDEINKRDTIKQEILSKLNTLLIDFKFHTC